MINVNLLKFQLQEKEYKIRFKNLAKMKETEIAELL